MKERSQGRCQGLLTPLVNFLTLPGSVIYQWGWREAIGRRNHKFFFRHVKLSCNLVKRTISCFAVWFLPVKLFGTISYTVIKGEHWLTE